MISAYQIIVLKLLIKIFIHNLHKFIIKDYPKYESKQIN